MITRRKNIVFGGLFFGFLSMTSFSFTNLYAGKRKVVIEEAISGPAKTKKWTTGLWVLLFFSSLAVFLSPLYLSSLRGEDSEREAEGKENMNPKTNK